MTPVTDLRDVRSMIPRVRRALDGPHATAPGLVTGGLSDQEVTNSIADAIAEVIFYTGGTTVFGHTLEVTERDVDYLAPVAWQTDTALTDPEQTVIVAQCSINHFFWLVRELKVQETINNEARQWSYQLSATLIRDQLKLLQDARDRALEEVKAQGVALDAYYSFVAERDIATARNIEWWVTNPGSHGPQGDGGEMLLDYRF